MSPYFQMPETKKELGKLMLPLIYKNIFKLIPDTLYFMKPTEANFHRVVQRNDCPLF